MLNYILATNKSWHIEYFLKNRHTLNGHWSVATTGEDLEKLAENLKPRYIFFPHWSEIVPASIYDTYECVCFHMTDVPFGRGGSPLQNLIARGYTNTKLSALRMTKHIDAGPVYLKKSLELSGTAFDIYNRSASICFEMMAQILSEDMLPTEQTGEVTVFARRQPKDSEILEIETLSALYDKIRMLDAPGYPASYIRFGEYLIEFTDAELGLSGELHAKVKVIKSDK